MLIQRGLVQRPRLNQDSSHNDGIIIGSVERFQGNERKVIILSTVRSKGEGMGFLKDYQRFNVAITRAKELLLVIGDPQVLMKNKNWRQLIFHTRKQKSYFQGLPNDPAIKDKVGVCLFVALVLFSSQIDLPKIRVITGCEFMVIKWRRTKMEKFPKLKSKLKG